MDGCGQSVRTIVDFNRERRLDDGLFLRSMGERNLFVRQGSESDIDKFLVSSENKLARILSTMMSNEALEISNSNFSAGIGFPIDEDHFF